MKLVSISFRNLKGITAKLDLTAINVLIGPNFTGKTARADAIRLLLLGFLPELGKRPADTFEICSGNELFVEGTFEDGSKLERIWFLKGDSVKTTYGTYCAENGRNQAASVIEQEDRFATMLDASTYFGLSDRDRVEYVFQNVPGTLRDFKPAEITAKLAGELLDPDGPSPDAIGAFMKRLSSHVMHVESAPEFTAWTEATYLDALLSFAVEDAKAGRLSAQTFERTIQGLAHLRAADERPENPNDLLDEEKKQAAALESAREEKARHVAGYELAQKNLTRSATLRRELVSESGFITGKREAEENLARLIEAAGKLPTTRPDDLAALRLELSEATAARIRDEAEEKQVTDAIFSNENERESIASLTICPVCHAPGETWKAGRESEIDGALRGLKAKAALLAENVGKLRAHESNLKARVTVAAKAIDDQAAARNRVDLARNRVTEIERTVERFASLRRELEALPAPDPEMLQAVENAQARMNAAQDSLAAINRAKSIRAARTGELVRLAEAEKRRDEAKEAEITAKGAQTILRKLCAKAVEETFGPLLDLANLLAAPLLLSPLAYLDGEIGTWRSGLWVGHGTFSGTEKAIAYAAIQFALTSTSPFRAMLIDELGRLDADTATKLVVQLGLLVKAGKLDLFLGIDTSRAELYEAAALFDGVDLTVTRLT